jgi:hypothetical protein
MMLLAAGARPAGRVGPAAVGGVGSRAGRDDVVDTDQHSLVEDEVGRRQLARSKMRALL